MIVICNVILRTYCGEINSNQCIFVKYMNYTLVFAVLLDCFVLSYTISDQFNCCTQSNIGAFRIFGNVFVQCARCVDSNANLVSKRHVQFFLRLGRVLTSLTWLNLQR